MHVLLIIKIKAGGLKTTMEEDTEGEQFAMYMLFKSTFFLQCICFFQSTFLDFAFEVTFFGFWILQCAWFLSQTFLNHIIPEFQSNFIQGEVQFLS